MSLLVCQVFCFKSKVLSFCVEFKDLLCSLFPVGWIIGCEKVYCDGSLSKTACCVQFRIYGPSYVLGSDFLTEQVQLGE